MSFIRRELTKVIIIIIIIIIKIIVIIIIIIIIRLLNILLFSAKLLGITLTYFKTFWT